MLLSRLLMPVIALLLLASSTFGLVATALAQDVPRFEEEDCDFEVPDNREVECGFVIVPEDRSDPDSPEIRLAVALYRSDARNPEADPIIYLSGGPGGSVIESLPDYAENAFAAYLDFDRDFIFFDQRGVGASEPALDCPEIDDLTLETLDDALTDAEGEALFLEAMEQCRDRLVEDEDVNLNAYSTFESAADVRDIVLALGYEEVNLYGISYGTRLGLAVMRDHPEIVRSAILDSVVAPQLDKLSDQPMVIYEQVERLFEACAADPDCDEAFPDLREVFYDTARELEEDPVMLTVDIEDEGEFDYLFDGGGLINVVIELMYITDIIADIPQLIYDARDGNFDFITFYLGLTTIDTSFSLGLFYNMLCREDAAFSSVEAITAAYDSIDDMGEIRYRGDGTTSDDSIFDFCDLWGADPADRREVKQIFSDIPSLLIAGEFDPVTPPSWAQLVGEGLRNSVYYEFPGGGHGSSLDFACAGEIAGSFLSAPAEQPEDDCYEDVTPLVFSVPGRVEAVELVEFEEEDLGIRGIAPADWENDDPGFWVSDDGNVLLQGAYQFDGEELIARFAEILELDEDDFELLDTYEGQVNGFEWELYSVEGDGLVIDIAYYETDDATYGVILVSAPLNRDGLYETVFLPCVDALEALD